MTDDYPDTGDPVLDYQANLWRAMNDSARQRYRDTGTLRTEATFEGDWNVATDPDKGTPLHGPTPPTHVLLTYPVTELDRAAGLTP